MAEEAKKKAQEEGLIGLIWDELQIVGGTVITVVGLGLTPFTGGVSIGLVVLGGSMVVGGVNSAINHTSMAITGNGYNLVGNLTNEVGQWYNKSIGKSLGKTGAYGFVNGFVSGTGEMVSGMAQFSVYDTGKTVYTLCTNHEARAQVGTSIGNWWNQVRSGNTYVIGQTTAVAASVLVAPEDIGAATSDASKVDSLLGKIGTFSKSVAISSAENAKSLITLPGRSLNNLKNVAVFVNGKLIPASGEAIENFSKVLKNTGKDLKGLSHQEEVVIAGVGRASVGPNIEFSNVVENFKNGICEVKDNFVKAVKSGDKGVGNPSGKTNYSTEEWYNYLKEKYGEDNVYLCTDEKSLINSVSEKLEKYRTNIDGKVYGKTAVAYGKDLDTVSMATSNSHQYNPTILTDGEKFNNDTFNKILKECNGKESVAYSKYYEYTLTKDYIKSLPGEYFTGKGIVKDDVISQMKKLTDAIEDTKNQARMAGEFSDITKEPSFQGWNVENCAEVWSTRKAILNGAKFDDISFKCVETKTGNYAKPCENCKRTFSKLNNVGKVK